jgi:hypothetical protein
VLCLEICGKRHAEPSAAQPFVHHPSALYISLLFVIINIKYTGASDSGFAADGYDTLGYIGTIFGELEWKTPIFSMRAGPKTPNASQAHPPGGAQPRRPRGLLFCGRRRHRPPPRPRRDHGGHRPGQVWAVNKCL